MPNRMTRSVTSSFLSLAEPVLYICRLADPADQFWQMVIALRALCSQWNACRWHYCGGISVLRQGYGNCVGVWYWGHPIFIKHCLPFCGDMAAGHKNAQALHSYLSQFSNWRDPEITAVRGRLRKWKKLVHQCPEEYLSYDPYGPARAFIAKLLRKSPYEGRTRWREQGRKKPSGPARIAYGPARISYGSSRDAN